MYYCLDQIVGTDGHHAIPPVEHCRWSDDVNIRFCPRELQLTMTTTGGHFLRSGSQDYSSPWVLRSYLMGSDSRSTKRHGALQQPFRATEVELLLLGT